MAIIEKIHVADGVGVFIVEFEQGDPLTSDDAATVPLDYASVPFAPILDRHMAGWSAKSLFMAASILPGDGLQVADGTNLTEPFAIACGGHSKAGDVWEFDTTIDLNKNPEPAIELCLIASTDADGALDAANAYRAMVVIGPKRNGLKSPFGSLPETATASGA